MKPAYIVSHRSSQISANHRQKRKSSQTRFADQGGWGKTFNRNDCSSLNVRLYIARQQTLTLQTVASNFLTIQSPRPHKRIMKWDRQPRCDHLLKPCLAYVAAPHVQGAVLGECGGLRFYNHKGLQKFHGLESAIGEDLITDARFHGCCSAARTRCSPGRTRRTSSRSWRGRAGGC